MLRTQFLGLGSYVPERVVKNDEIRFLNDRHVAGTTVNTETDDAWIQQRTGIKERRYVNEGTYTSDLALEASKRAIADAGIQATDIDCIIFATLSPDIHFPGSGVYLQRKLGIAEKTHCPCFDIRQQCSGFVYGLQMADAFIRTGTYKRVLLVGAEVHSHSLDYTTRGRDVMVLFGDGAGAVVLGPQETDDPKDREVNQMMYPQMDGKRVYVRAVREMNLATQKALADTGLTWNDINWFVPHQANLRINEKVVEVAQIPAAKVLNSIDIYGNTTAATVPLTMDHWRQQGKVKRGDRILTSVFGSGYTWGAAIFTF